MFDIGGGELFGLAVIAVLLFGPERLPRIASEGARILRKVREFTAETSAQLKDETGADIVREIAEVTRTIRSPKRAIVSSLLGDALVDGPSSSSLSRSSSAATRDMRDMTTPHFDPDTP